MSYGSTFCSDIVSKMNIYLEMVREKTERGFWLNWLLFSSSLIVDHLQLTGIEHSSLHWRSFLFKIEQTEMIFPLFDVFFLRLILNNEKRNDTKTILLRSLFLLNSIWELLLSFFFLICSLSFFDSFSFSVSTANKTENHSWMIARHHQQWQNEFESFSSIEKI